MSMDELLNAEATDDLRSQERETEEQLREAVWRKRWIDRRITKIENEKVKLEQEGRELHGWGDRGRIPQLRTKLTRIKRLIEDESLPTVVWLRRENFIGREDRDYVVERVTAKRIYIRQKGDSGTTARSFFYRHDGTAESDWNKSQINIELTFPQGVKPTKAANISV